MITTATLLPAARGLWWELVQTQPDGTRDYEGWRGDICFRLSTDDRFSPTGCHLTALDTRTDRVLAVRNLRRAEAERLLDPGSLLC